MSKTVVIAGALDTKGAEFAFVKELIESHGVSTVLVDFGVLGEPTTPPEVSNAEVAKAGGGDLEELRSFKNKAEAMKIMTAGLTAVVRELYAKGRLQGLLGMGGTGGTAIATAAMRALPVGVPKVMVSTVGGSDVSPYVASRDIVMIPSVVDVAGINRISRLIYANAAGAIAGMVKTEASVPEKKRPLIATSMFGNTTQCVDRSRTALEEQGYEVLVFHATGAGGRTMKSLADDGFLNGILDLTTTELADEVCGGVFSAGPERPHMASARSIPMVLAPGCVDMCNFWARRTVPEKYQGRKLYEWNPNVTLMRTNIEENERIGKLLAATANLAKGAVAVVVPLRGVSMLDSVGNPFWDPAADRSCFEAIKSNLKSDIPFLELDANINDFSFADCATRLLLDMLKKEAEEA
ncbi:MAG: Tm-1-like ATP-binding domain-containing protein [Acidobacteriota bacterium]